MVLRTIVLLGDVGTGKSRLVEKISGKTGLSANTGKSYTRQSSIFRSSCNRLRVVDTPGANSFDDRVGHTMQVAQAMSYAELSLVLLVVKADVRIDITLEKIQQYAERFLDFEHLMAVCVTHMDISSKPPDQPYAPLDWSISDMSTALDGHFGITKVMFSRMDSSALSLTESILQECVSPETISINSSNFLRYFRIHPSKRKIMKSVDSEVGRFRNIVKSFRAKFALQPAALVTDCVFEFQTWMTAEITQAQQRVSTHNSFDFSNLDDKGGIAEQSGYLAVLTNQLRDVLYEVRLLCLGYHAQAGVSTLRKCPHCGAVWAKISGCDGGTTCGNKMSTVDARVGRLNSFAFTYVSEQIMIQHIGSREVTEAAVAASKLPRLPGAKAAKTAGCGGDIRWEDMSPVTVPPEFAAVGVVSVADIDPLPVEAAPAWDATFKSLKATTPSVKVC